MDGVAIYNYALSSSQVTTLYGDSTNGPGNPMALPSSPIAYYPLGTSAWNGEYLAENNAIGDYVFDFGTFTSNDRIVINNNFDTIITGTDFTISSWVNLDSVASNQLRFIFTNESLQFTITNKITTYLRGASGYFLSPFDSNTTLSTGKWYNVVLVKSGSDYTYYLNGSADGTVNNSTSVVNSSETTSLIGDYYGAGTLGFDGRISNTQIFNTALSATDIETLYNYGSPIQTLANIPQSSNLKAWYKLDATEIYNSTSTEWSVDNNQNPSAYPSSLNFNRATTDSISLGSSSSIRPTGDYTFSIWYNLSSSANAGVWCAATSINSSGLALFKGNSGGLELYHKGTSSTSAVVFLGSASGTLNIWQNAIFTYDDTSRVIKGYLNGNLISTVSVAGTGSVSWANNFYLGRLIQNGNYYLGGRLSNFQIFNTKLEEIGSNSVETLYNSGNPLTDMSSFSSLVSWWKLNNTTTGIQDSKGSNNGTNNGATEYAGFVNTLAGDSSGMSQSNLVQSDLQTVAPYSKYALDFDGNDYIDCGNSADFSFGNGTTDSPFSTSFWFKLNSNSGTQPFLSKDNVTKEWTVSIFGGGGIRIFLKNQGSNNQQSIDSTTTFSTGVWYHAVTTYDGRGGANAADGLSIYINGSLDTPTNVIKNSYTAMSSSSSDVTIGKYGGNYINGVMSNVSIWNAALTSAQVTEIYNEGLPSNLNSHSAYSNLVSWWQLGSNSSFNGNDWIVADEIGSNNGESDGMGVDALTNGVGTTANGVSTGMSEGSLVGDAPYSTANALSRGMAVTAKGTDVPPTLFNNTYSLNFDGTNETLRFIDANGSYTFNEFAGSNGTQSYSFWIKPDIDGSLDWIISGNHVAYGGFLFDNGQLRYYARYQGDFYFDLTLTNNVWQHVAVVFDSNGLVQPYKNGQPTTALTNIPMPYKSYYDRIGMLENRYHPIKGNLDEFSIYNYALSANQVKSIYNGVFGTPSNVLNLNPILYYRFEEGTGTTINDSSTAGSNAVKSNGVTFQTEAP